MTYQCCISNCQSGTGGTWNKPDGLGIEKYFINAVSADLAISILISYLPGLVWCTSTLHICNSSCSASFSNSESKCEQLQVSFLIKVETRVSIMVKMESLLPTCNSNCDIKDCYTNCHITSMCLMSIAYTPEAPEVSLGLTFVLLIISISIQWNLTTAPWYSIKLEVVA